MTLAYIQRYLMLHMKSHYSCFVNQKNHYYYNTIINYATSLAELSRLLHHLGHTAFQYCVLWSCKFPHTFRHLSQPPLWSLPHPQVPNSSVDRKPASLKFQFFHQAICFKSTNTCEWWNFRKIIVYDLNRTCNFPLSSLSFFIFTTTLSSILSRRRSRGSFKCVSDSCHNQLSIQKNQDKKHLG